MTKTLFAHVIDCIRDNNETNGGGWSDWEDGTHAIETYAPSFQGECSEAERVLCVELLDMVIKRNGVNLGAAITEWNRCVWGTDFSQIPLLEGDHNDTQTC